MQKEVLNVSGMSCGHCVNSVEGALEKIGVTGKVDLKNGTVSVEYDENNISIDKVKAEIEEQGYEVN